MKINVIEDTKKTKQFEVEGANHGFANMIIKELWKDSDVKVATYKIDHPLINIPDMLVEGKDAKTSIQSAIKSLKKQNKTFRTALSKAK